MTLAEITQAVADEQMIGLTAAAIYKKAAAIVGEQGLSANRRNFAEIALRNPDEFSDLIWRYVVGANAAATLDAVLRSDGNAATPTDQTIETAVNTAIDALWS